MSCSQRWCRSHYPPLIDSVVVWRDSTITIVKDTTILINIPGETDIDSILVECDSLSFEVKIDSAYLKTSFAYAVAWYEKPYIRLKLSQIDTMIQIRLDSAIRESIYWHGEFTRINESHQVKFIPGFYKFCTFAFIGGCIIIIFLILMKILKI